MPIPRTLKAFLVSLAFVVSASLPVGAQVTVDVAKISCDQFVLFKVANPDTIAVWLHGYYSGKSGNTVVDVERLKTNQKKLRDYCVQNPDVMLVQAVEDLLKP